MFRTAMFLTLVLIVAGLVYAGDVPQPGKREPGILAQQYFRETLAGNPGRDPSRTEAISARFFTGAAADDIFGRSVAGAGDVNGDGFGDVIVGAIVNDAAGTDAGRAYVYFGGAGMDATADVILTGAVAGDYFGWAVAGIGDLNGDGYSDVIVSAVFNIYNPFGFPDLFPYLPWGETNGLIRV